MSVYVNNPNNIVGVNPVFNTVNVLPDTNSTIVEVITPGPQGPQGPPGDPSIFTGSYLLTSSFDAFTASYNTGSFTGSFIGSFTGFLFGTSSFALTSSYSNNINGLVKYIALFDTENSLSSSALHQSNSYSIIINREFATALNPEALFVFQPNTESINIATFESNVDNYSQINVRNESAGGDASSDIVVTANNGDEFYYYLNMGINSSNYTPGYIGGPNDAYFYSLAENFHIGNAAADGSHLGFFVGGDNVDTYNKLTLSPNNLHTMTGSLDINNFLLIRNGLTVQDGANNDVLTVSESIVRVVPNASAPTGTTNAGSIWFTSTAMYVGLE